MYYLSICKVSMFISLDDSTKCVCVNIFLTLRAYSKFILKILISRFGSFRFLQKITDIYNYWGVVGKNANLLCWKSNGNIFWSACHSFGSVVRRSPAVHSKHKRFNRSWERCIAGSDVDRMCHLQVQF